MKIQVNIKKKHFFILLGFISVLVVAGVAYAVNTNQGWHSSDQIDFSSVICSGACNSPIIAVPDGAAGQVVVDDPFYVSNNAKVSGRLTIGSTEIYDNEINIKAEAVDKGLFLGNRNTDRVIVPVAFGAATIYEGSTRVCLANGANCLIPTVRQVSVVEDVTMIWPASNGCPVGYSSFGLSGGVVYCQKKINVYAP